MRKYGEGPWVGGLGEGHRTGGSDGEQSTRADVAQHGHPYKSLAGTLICSQNLAEHRNRLFLLNKN